MTVKSNYAIAIIATLSDSFKHLGPIEGKPKPITTCMHDSSCALSKLHVIATNLDWFIALFTPAVIGRSNCYYFGISFTTLN